MGIWTVPRSSEDSSIDVPMKSNDRQLQVSWRRWLIKVCYRKQWTMWVCKLYKAIQNIVWKPSWLVLDEPLVISRIIKDKENRDLNMHCFCVWVRVQVHVHINYQLHIAVNCLLHQKTRRPSGRTEMLSSDLGNHGRLLNYWVTNMLAYL